LFDPSMMGPPQPAAPQGFDEKVAAIKQLLVGLATDDGSDVDPIEEAKIAKILAQVADLGANRAKEQQAALGGGPATNFIGRALGGS
jgi:hypothetical protein